MSLAGKRESAWLSGKCDAKIWRARPPNHFIVMDAVVECDSVPEAGGMAV